METTTPGVTVGNVCRADDAYEQYALWSRNLSIYGVVQNEKLDDTTKLPMLHIRHGLPIHRQNRRHAKNCHVDGDANIGCDNRCLACVPRQTTFFHVAKFVDVWGADVNRDADSLYASVRHSAVITPAAQSMPYASVRHSVVLAPAAQSVPYASMRHSVVLAPAAQSVPYASMRHSVVLAPAVQSVPYASVRHSVVLAPALDVWRADLDADANSACCSQSLVCRS